ncbi:hypothetical protein [Cryptosporangium minutisporangium]|uniref:Uncharacterized protein n=1 Tax=Cryptosporangium minutisporangium TaxID=113569 RepID=A0ABP6STX6_9ACTN
MSETVTQDGWRTRTNTTWAAPLPCTSQALSALPPEPTVEQVDDAEAAELLRAFTRANSSLARAHEGLRATSQAMSATYQDAAHAIDGVTRYSADSAIRRAVALDEKVARRHAADGPESRQRRRVPSWLVWPALIASAIFDGAFVGLVVQQILNVGSDDAVYYLAYLPGIGMALALFVTGTMLAENLFRHRERVIRRPFRGRLTPWTATKRLFWEWRPEREERADEDLPWPRLAVPFLLTIGLLGLLGLFGYIRAALATRDFPELGRIMPIFVLLLLILSVATVALKVLAHNPYADSRREAERLMRRVHREAATVRKRANDAVAAHTVEWHTYRAAVVQAENEARRILDESCAGMLDERGQRGYRGTLRLPLDGPEWPPDHWSGRAGRGPKLDLTILGPARDLVRRRHPKLLERRLAKAIAAQNAQFGRAEQRAGVRAGQRS